MKLLNRTKTTLTGLWLATGMLVAAQPQMDMVQTLSDQAQGMTIAFDALAFLTGSLGADSFLPPGKVADFSGFQYLRDNDPTELGHNTDFVTIIANNILNLLSSAQVAQLVERAQIQADLINQYGYQRFPLMDAFRRQLAGALPAGTSGLDLAAVKSYSGELYRLDGRISLDRALLFGSLLRSFDSSQLSALNHLATLGGVGHWPQNLADPLRGLNLAPEIGVGVMTYASEMYSWYAGSVAADTYFCPERQGTYFGSFYLKDAPAMGNPNYSIGTNLTADSGNALLAALAPAQQTLITNLVTVQKPYLYELVNTRSNIAVRLRQLLVASAIDTNAVLDLCYHYGELDGQIVYSYATHFAQVGQSLGANQQAALQALRLQLLGQELLYPSGAYLYSAPIAMPAITNTDFLFGTNSITTNALSVVATGASLTKLASGLHFTEGPAADAAGNLFFADIPGNTIYEWSLANQLSVFRTNSGGANGLGFDRAGNLLACEGSNGRVVSITPQGGVASLASAYAGVRFNEPNDLWVDPAGGVYFTDPVYFGHAAVQGGEHVYYLSPDRARLVRVAADLVRPNGLAGTADGKTLYVADWGATKVFRYTINADGTLGNQTLFASVKCDGLTLDALGHVYLCETAVLVYDAAGRALEQISVPERPTNLEFGGRDRQTLFITTDAGSLYSIPMRVQGVAAATPTPAAGNSAPAVAKPIPAQAGTYGKTLAFTLAAGTFTSTNLQPLVYSSKNLPPGLSVNPTNGAITGTPARAGTYAAAVVAYLQGAPALTAEAGFTFTIQKAPLTVTANPKSRAYGADNPALDRSYGGLVNGDSSAAITNPPSISTTATKLSPAGTYVILLSGGSSDNYALTLVNGTLTVSKAVVTATSGARSRAYGAANPTFTINYSGFLNGETESVLDVKPSATTAATVSSAVGTYPITPGGGLDNNYSFKYVPGVLTVYKAALTARADAKSRVYGAANPALTITYSGFLNGDTVARLSSAPTASTTATATSVPGIYPITLKGGVDANYTIALANSTLTVLPQGLPPVANSDAWAVYRNQPASLAAVQLKANDTDPDGDTLTVAGVSAASAKGGGVTLANGLAAYSPPKDYVGMDSFTYTVTDGHGNHATGTVNVTVKDSLPVPLVYGPVKVGGKIVLRWAGSPGVAYTIEYRGSLNGTWQKRATLTAPSTAGVWGLGVFEYSEPVPGTSMGFYRAIYPAY